MVLHRCACTRFSLVGWSTRYKPTMLNRLFCLGVAAALSGYCEAVAMEMWVRVLMCQSSLDPVLAMESKQLQLEKAADSSRI